MLDKPSVPEDIKTRWSTCQSCGYKRQGYIREIANERELQDRIEVAFTLAHNHPGISVMTDGSCLRCNAEGALYELARRSVRRMPNIRDREADLSAVAAFLAACEREK